MSSIVISFLEKFSTFTYLCLAFMQTIFYDRFNSLHEHNTVTVLVVFVIVYLVVEPGMLAFFSLFVLLPLFFSSGI